MALFTVHVELRNIKDLNDDAYDKLHELMEKAGFYRTITASDGSVDHLPPALIL
jgi:prolyl-tRNA synthetase